MAWQDYLLFFSGYRRLLQPTRGRKSSKVLKVFGTLFPQCNFTLGFVRESCKCHVLTFDSVDETLRCNHSARQMKEVAPVLSHGVLFFSIIRK